MTDSREYSTSSQVYLWVFLLWAILAAVDMWWILHDRQPQGCDQAGHLMRAMDFAHALRPFSLQNLLHFWRAEFGEQGGYTYPPLYHMVTGTLIWILGRLALAGTVSNEIFFWILLVSVIQIGKRAFDLTVGISAAALVGFYATLAQFRHEAFIDFALTAMTSWCAWQLVRTEGFRLRKASIGFGASMGLVFLLKQGAVIFLGLPVLYLFFHRRREWNREIGVNFFFAVGTGFLLALPWYGIHWHAVLANLALNQRVASIEGDPMPWTLIGAIYYPWVMSCIQIGFPLFVLAIVSALIWIFKRKRQTETSEDKHLSRGIIITWIVGSIAILTFLVLNKDIRYSLPVLPAVALLTCSASVWTRRHTVRIAWFVLLAVCAFPYYTSIMFAWPPMRRDVGFYTGPVYWLVWTDNYYFGAGPKQEDWHIPEMLARMHSEFPHATALNPIRFAVVPFLLRFNLNSLTLEADEREIPIAVTQVGNDSQLSTLDAMLTYDFLFIKTGDLGLPFETNHAREIQEVMSLHPGNFVSLATYSMPDHSTGTFFRIVRETK